MTVTFSAALCLEVINTSHYSHLFSHEGEYYDVKVSLYLPESVTGVQVLLPRCLTTEAGLT